MMKVLVTGGAGFIGSHICELLISSGIQTIIIDNLSRGIRRKLPKGVTFYEMDIRSSSLDDVFKIEKPTHVIHHAAQVNVHSSMSNPMEDASINIIGTLNLLECSVKYGIKKFIYASSSAVYGNSGDVSITEDYPLSPISNYGISKLTPEAYIKAYHLNQQLDYTILRYSNVYGPRQAESGEGGVISIFIKNYMNNEPITIFGDGNQTRDFIYVKDVARANLHSLYKGNNKTINISSNKKTSINSLNLLIKQYFIRHSLPPNYLCQRSGDIQFSQLNNERAIKYLDWKPQINLAQGLFETLGYFRSEENH